MRKKIVAANWKMNMTQGEAERFMESFFRDVGEITDVEVVIIPPFTAIAKVSEALGRAQNIKVGAQNMYWEKSGPYTGEISAPLLRDLFVHYVVLGHSERRTLFGETDEMVNRKVRAAHEAKLRGSRLAPPTRAPSMSGWVISSRAFSGLTLPPY